MLTGLKKSMSAVGSALSIKKRRSAGSRHADGASSDGRPSIDAAVLSAVGAMSTMTEKVDKQRIDDVMENLPKEFFTAQFDPVDYALKQIEEQRHPDILEGQESQATQYLEVITHMLAEKVKKNYNAFVQGFAKIHEVGSDLEQTASLCGSSRQQLQDLDEHLVANSKKIVERQNRQRILRDLTNTLEDLRTLLDMERRIFEVIEDEDFPRAITLVNAFLEMSQHYSQFNCLQSMNANAKGTFAAVQKRMDDSTRELCREFNDPSFLSILTAYSMIKKPHLVFEKLSSSFSERSERVVRDIVMSFALKNSQVQAQVEEFKRGAGAQLSRICPFVQDEDINACLLNILSSLVDVMANYAVVSNALRVKATDLPEHRKVRDSYGELKTGLDAYRKQFFDFVQKDISIFLSQANIGHMKIDKFVDLYIATRAFSEVGDMFCGKRVSTTLLGSLGDVARGFFDAFHRENLDVLKTILETETWHRMALSSFSVADLVEFRKPKNKLNRPTGSTDLSSKVDFSKELENPFRELVNSVNGGISMSRSRSASQMQSQQMEYEEDESLHIVDKFSSSDAVFTPCVLNMLRYLGRYLQMMEMMPTIASDIFDRMCSIFVFFFHSVFVHFANPRPGDRDSVYDPLEDRENLTPSLWVYFSQVKELTTLLGVPAISVDISLPVSLYGALERTVAIESVSFLLDFFLLLRSRLEPLLPESQRNIMTQFFATSASVVGEARLIIYYRLSKQLLPYDSYVSQINNCKFDIKDTMDNNPYVNAIVANFRDLKAGLESLQIQEIRHGAVLRILYHFLSLSTMEALLEGFVHVKKCSNAGRALMSIDLKTLQSGVERLVGIRPLPGAQVVDAYIKSFYLPENEVLAFFHEHKELTAAEMIAVVNIGVGKNMDRKNKQALCAQIESVERDRERTAHRPLAMAAFDSLKTVAAATAAGLPS